MNNPERKNCAGQRQVSIKRYFNGAEQDSIVCKAVDDIVAVESPLEIRIVFSDSQKRKDRSLSITMRTPGDDHALAAGFLYSEGIISSAEHFDGFEACGPIAEGETISNQLRVNLVEGYGVDMSRLQRHFYTTSSCGVCGKASLEAVEAQNVTVVTGDQVTLDPRTILSLPDHLQNHQSIFGNTGGLHAAGLLTPAGQVLGLAEDVGRHNAVDKLIGRYLIEKQEHLLKQNVLAVSGRTSFELVQKAATAGIPVMAAVGAPSSLAIELAERFGLTLIGFNSGEKFNVYTHNHRIREAGNATGT